LSPEGLRHGHRKLREQLNADGITRIFGTLAALRRGLLDEINKFGEIEYAMVCRKLLLLANTGGRGSYRARGIPDCWSKAVGKAFGHDGTTLSARRQWSSAALG